MSTTHKNDNSETGAEVFEAYLELCMAAMDHREVFAQVACPDTWLDCRLQMIPDLTLENANDGKVWFPVFTGRPVERRKGARVVKADLFQVMTYVAELSSVEGLVIDPYTAPLCISREILQGLLASIRATLEELDREKS